MPLIELKDSHKLSSFYQKYQEVIPQMKSYLLSAEEAQLSVQRGALASEIVPGEIAALILFQDLGAEVEVLVTATAPAHRRQGLMSALLSELASLSPEKNLWLEVSEQNDPAKSLYLGLGFVQVGFRRDYYGAGENALLLSWPPPRKCC